MALSTTPAILASLSDRSGPLPIARIQHRTARLLAGLALACSLAPGLAGAQPSAVIAANRTSGVGPLAVRFDATGTNCDGNGASGEWSADLEQCLYSWDFGDSTAPPYEYGATAMAGQVASANNATGFIAGHVFENPGTYTVTLTIRNPSGQTAVRTQTISVSSFSGTTYCIRAGGSGSFSGCPTGATQITQSNFSSALSTCGATSGPRRCLFRRGDTFAAGNGVDLANGPGIIGAFGSGARPVVSGTGSGESGLIRDGNDWRIMDLDFVGVGHVGRRHRLFYRTRIRDITANGVAGLLWWGSGLSDLYVVRSEIENNTGYYGLYVTAENLVVLGSRIANNGLPGNNKGNARTGDQNRTVWASNTLGPEAAGVDTGHVLRLHGENGGASRLVVRDNYIRTSSWASLIIRPQYDSAIEAGDDGPISMVVVESNYLENAISGSPSDLMMIFVAKAQQVAVRNNICKLGGPFGICVAVHARSPSSYAANNVDVLHNTAAWLSGSNNSGTAAFDVESTLSNIRVANNLLYHGSAFSGPVTSCGGSSCSLNTGNIKTSTNPFGVTSFDHPWRFRLASGSQPEDAGVMRNEVLADFGNTVRSGSRDVGAWESGSAGGPPPPPILLP